MLLGHLPKLSIVVDQTANTTKLVASLLSDLLHCVRREEIGAMSMLDIHIVSWPRLKSYDVDSSTNASQLDAFVGGGI